MADKQAVPLLTKEQAKLIAEVYKLPFMRAEVESIASGGAVVIPRITREALREALGVPIQRDQKVQFSFNDIIAALKRLNIEVQP